MRRALWRYLGGVRFLVGEVLLKLSVEWLSDVKTALESIVYRQVF